MEEKVQISRCRSLSRNSRLTSVAAPTSKRRDILLTYHVSDLGGPGDVPSPGK